ncbi:Dimeric dUTPase, all-alpha-NTP-PPase (MazG) superfamily [Halolactibacillus halophilus]|uniref:Dimeric dUTPase, all-alpha-NTP-PPase (MazG) superfamily n=1 Tax=Halolactibacillus halophilus TaxID=306540 RepID=A0A1I5MPG6_9BACI|nr:dUTP diphosphatase [Halolactibacillus halophilus]GEM02514.1 hypothetical protein HHA03_20460 [Halolactibacillus halophilus]SFP10821.1 Dimeric dUTPase, all-alpha-NTP-PPase (MazG) superfamily [Halolactibacillus halophilus]
MDLKQLFETQRKLDERIVEEKGLQGKDLLAEKYLALRTELGELANEWRGFKFWSEDQKPRTKGSWVCYTGVENGDFINLYENPLLEEYVDCLHFLLSIGNEYHFSVYTALKPTGLDYTILHQFNQLFNHVESVKNCMSMGVLGSYEMLFNGFLNLGRLLGFTDEQIEQAYYDKNKTNHERQYNGY